MPQAASWAPRTTRPPATPHLCRYGPREVGRGSEFQSTGSLTCDFKYAPFAKHPRLERNNELLDAERLVADSLAKTLAPAVILQKYPKASIELCILVLQSDGGEWPACVLASSLAIADAGIEMYGLVLAATVGRVPPPAPAAGAGAASSSSASAALAASGASSRVFVDLSGAEEAASASSTTVAYCRALDRILHTSHRGELGVSELVHDTGFALETCAVVERVARQVLVAAEARKASKPAPAAAGAGGAAALSAT